MSKISANELIQDIRSGVGDSELMRKFRLTEQGLQFLLKTLVNDRMIEHTELYDLSPAYAVMADRLNSRRFPRAYVPTIVSIIDEVSAQEGFLRDISVTGVRVAGIQVQVGEEMSLRLPLEDISECSSIEFKAVCRWTKIKGKKNRYVASGFEIVEISDEDRSQLIQLIELFRSRSTVQQRLLYDPLNTVVFIDPESEQVSAHASPGFSGTLNGVDILDLTQFMLWTGNKTILVIKTVDKPENLVYIDDGKIVHAVSGSLDGQEAFYRCMSFTSGEFFNKEWDDQIEYTIGDPPDFLLMEAARRRDEEQCITRIETEIHSEIV